MYDKNNIRILNLEPDGYSLKAQSLLESFAIVDTGPLSREDLLKVIHKFDVLIVRLNHKIDLEILNSAVRLKVIVTATTGLNHIDIEKASKRGIKVLSLKDERDFLDRIYATAEHTWALLLSLIRKVPHAYMHALSGKWNRENFKGLELQGRTLGVIGVGRLGTKVANYGIAFGMKVLGHDVKKIGMLPDTVNMTTLDQVLTGSDIICLHVDYNSGNHKMIGEREFHLMKKGSFFINTSRGELVDETALYKVLESGHLGGAALDVLSGENTGWSQSKFLIDYARKNQNLIITPHIGGCTGESMELTEIFMAEKLSKYVNNGIFN